MSSKINEHDEFLLSQLVDGDLPADVAAMLQERLKREPELQQCYEALCRLNQTLAAHGTKEPTVDLDAFHADFMQRLMAEASTNNNVSEQDEWLIGQLLDDQLTTEQQSKLEIRLQSEPVLRQCHAELSRLHGVLQDRQSDQPTVDYERFHSQVMSKIAAEASANKASANKSASKQRPWMLRFPMWARIATPMAIAAAITLVVLFGPWSRSLQQPSQHPMGSVAHNTTPTNTMNINDPVDQPLSVVVAVAKANAPDAAVIEVNVERPDASNSVASNGIAAIHVSVQENKELAAAVQKADTERLAQPQQRVIFVGAVSYDHDNSDLF
ncbi:MAG: hypothetical protein FWC56_03680 [Phycisphaerae bacterium]|nr:hypothetical protein [Phycisphaerae bacterium]